MGKKKQKKRNQNSSSANTKTNVDDGKSQKTNEGIQSSKQKELLIKEDNKCTEMKKDANLTNKSNEAVLDQWEAIDEPQPGGTKKVQENASELKQSPKKLVKQSDKADPPKKHNTNTVGVSDSKGNMSGLQDECSRDNVAWDGYKSSNKGDWNTKELKQNRPETKNWRERDEKEESEKQFDSWEKQCKKDIKFEVVHEIEGDIFEQPKEYSLAHCVAADLRMGSGIAVGFKQQFKNLDTLLDQRVKQGGVAILPDDKNERYIYYLVTKRESNGKPTYNTLWKSLWSMRDHIKEKQVKKLAIPRIGCGLDRLEWDWVKNMLEYLFKDIDIEIKVCNFQEPAEQQIAPKKMFKTCKLLKEEYHLTEIAPGTAIMYLTTEKFDIDSVMRDLDDKFNFLTEARRQIKRLGDCVIVEHREYIYCGCIVRKTNKDPISFESLKRCLQAFNKKNKSYGNDCLYYVGFQHIYDTDSYRDNQINDKVMTLFINVLRDVDVHWCTGAKK